MQVERVFYLWAKGSLTITAVEQNPKAPKIPRVVNQVSGKESGYESAFSEANWGDATRSYRKSVDEKLRASSIKIIMLRSKEYYNETKKRALKSLTDTQPIDVDAPDPRAELIDLSD